MKVLFLCNLAPRKLGAFEAFVVGMGERLVSNGDELVCVFAEEPCGDVCRELRRCNIKWYVVDSWNDERGVRPWAVCFPALRILHAEKPDVAAVHFGNELPLVLTILLSKISGLSKIRWVWHQRQQISAPSTWLQRNLSKIRVLSWACNHFAALYYGGKESLIMRGINSDSVSVIYNGVPRYVPTKQSGWLKAELGIPADSTIITNVSSLIPRKRVDFSIKAFAAVAQADKLNNLHLVLVGEGGEYAKLRELSESENISNRVHFMGRRNDVRDIMAESDLLILSSAAEACPWAIIEAMSVGLPCVSTNAGAAGELIENGVTGMVVECGDADGMSVCISNIIGNPQLSTAMSEAAKMRWEKAFTDVSVISRHCELYKKLVYSILS